MQSFHGLALVLGVGGFGTACVGDANGPSNTAPTAAFTTSCTLLVCTFTDGSSDADGTVLSFHWDFGDGAVATTQNSTHPYASAGTYAVELVVTDNSGATGTLSRQLTVTESQTGGQSAGIGLSPTSLHFYTRKIYATDPPSQQLSITNTAGGVLNWKASSSQTWLSVSPTSGTTPSPNLTVSVNTAGLTGSFYQGSITVSAVGASNSPQTVSVSLQRR
jgi:PKD repeat protein